MTSRAFSLIFTCLILVIIISSALIASDVLIIDDAYVYFNYARNFVEGRPFAHDPRNNPSEGFTSLLYLLLFIPVEFLKINAPLASVIINSVALALSIVWIGSAVHSLGLVPSYAAKVFTALLSVLVLSDSSIFSFSGLETHVGLLCATGIVISVSHALDERRAKQSRLRWLGVFFVASFLAHLVRPEYLIIGALGGIFLLWRSPDRLELLRYTAIFTFVMMIYYSLKLAIFGDLFPTGFYRKVRSSEWSYDFIWIWRNQYWSLVAIATAIYWIIFRPRAWGLRFLYVASVAILLFNTQVTPLMGVFNRFLVFPTWALYVIVGLGAVWIVSSALHRIAKGRVETVIGNGLAVSGLAVLLVFNLPKLQNFDLQARLDYIQTFQYPIYQLAKHWRAKASNPEAITMVFSEAGITPYTLGSIFVDSYGLLEPPIARLFPLPNGENKERLFIEYVLSKRPDVILDLQNDIQIEGDLAHVKTHFTIHSPFNGEMPAAVYEAYRDYGMVHGCYIRIPLPIHVLIWRDSPHGAETLKDIFCSHPHIDVRYYRQGAIVHAQEKTIYFPSLTSITSSFYSSDEQSYRTNYE